jgi:hypothetical protein
MWIGTGRTPYPLLRRAHRLSERALLSFRFSSEHPFPWKMLVLLFKLWNITRLLYGGHMQFCKFLLTDAIEQKIWFHILDSVLNTDSEHNTRFFFFFFSNWSISNSIQTFHWIHSHTNDIRFEILDAAQNRITKSFQIVVYEYPSTVPSIH